MKEHLYRADPARRAEIRRGLIDTLEQQPDIAFAYLHGSFLLEELEGFHDIDVAIWLAPMPEGREALDRQLTLMGVLSSRAGVEVDVQLLNEASLPFRFTAMHGAVVVCRDEELLSTLLEETMRDYFDVEPLRRRAFREIYAS